MNDVYLVRSDCGAYAVRCYRANWHTSNDVEYEIAFLRHLEAVGVPVAPPIRASDSSYRFQVSAPEGARDVVVFRWANGRALRGVLDAALARRAGQLLAKMHHEAAEFAGPGPRKTDYPGLLARELPCLLAVMAHDVERAEFCRIAGNEIVTALREVLDDLPAGPVHGDFHPGNVFVASDTNLTILDFDNCGEGARLEDIARWIWSIRFRGKSSEWSGAFRDGYESSRPLTPTERRYLSLFVAAQQQWFMGGMAANINAIGRGDMLPQGFEGEAKRLEELISEVDFLQR